MKMIIKIINEYIVIFFVNFDFGGFLTKINTIIIHKKYKSKVDKILNQLIKNGFNLRKGWELMTSINYLKKYPKMNLDSAKDIQSRIINLPSSSFLIKKS